MYFWDKTVYNVVLTVSQYLHSNFFSGFGTGARKVKKNHHTIFPRLRFSTDSLSK